MEVVHYAMNKAIINGLMLEDHEKMGVMNLLYQMTDHS